MTRVDQLIKEALLSKDKIALNAYKNLKKESEICFELANWMIEHGYNFHKKSTSVLKDNKISKTDFEEFDPIPKKEMGTAIKYLKSKFPTADGKLISTIVKEYCI